MDALPQVNNHAYTSAITKPTLKTPEQSKTESNKSSFCQFGLRLRSACLDWGGRARQQWSQVLLQRLGGTWEGQAHNEICFQPSCLIPESDTLLPSPAALSLSCLFCSHRLPPLLFPPHCQMMNPSRQQDGCQSLAFRRQPAPHFTQYRQTRVELCAHTPPVQTQLKLPYAN